MGICTRLRHALRQRRFRTYLAGTTALLASALLVGIPNGEAAAGRDIASGTSLGILAARPTATPPPKPTATPPTGGIPSCPHDSKKWHGLVERNASGQITCTYGHEHKDDPRSLDDKFGPLQYGEISHPWETAQENLEKHRVYSWYVVRDIPCINPDAGKTLSFTDFRVQAHADGHAGAQTRFHSYSIEAFGCDKSDPAYKGYVRIGGHADFGHLLLTKNPNPVIDVPLPVDNDPNCGDANAKISRRQHMAAGSNLAGLWFWYGDNNGCHLPGGGTRPVILNTLGISQEDWGPINPAAFNNPLLFHGTISGVTYNASRAEPVHVLGIHLPGFADKLDGTTDGKVTWEGYVNRYGEMVSGCTTPSMDCVPIKVQGMKLGTHLYRRSAQPSLPPTREYDVANPATGQSLIVFPN
jgi:hypothetical protein